MIGLQITALTQREDVFLYQEHYTADYPKQNWRNKSACQENSRLWYANPSCNNCFFKERHSIAICLYGNNGASQKKQRLNNYFTEALAKF